MASYGENPKIRGPQKKKKIINDKLKSMPPWAIPLHMSRLMEIEACHWPWLALYLGRSWDISPLSLSQTRRRLILLPLPIDTRVFTIIYDFLFLLWATHFLVFTAGCRTPFQHFRELRSPRFMSNLE